MLEGTYAYDDYHIQAFEILSKGKVPKELNVFYEIKNFNKNIKFTLYKEVLQNRISLFKTWLKEGKMNYFHLPLLTNFELFIYCIKMHFSQKYYGENDFAKVTPEMIKLKFHNEIIWVDGLVMHNATIDASNKHLVFSNMQTNIKQKLNLVGIIYTVEHPENNDESDNEEQEEENEEEEEEEEEKEKEDKEEKKENEEIKEKTEEEKQYEEILKENKKNEYKVENQSVKIYIYGNLGNTMINKFYNDEPIGYFEFKMINSNINGQNYIYEHDIKITVDDYDDFIQNSKQN